MIKVSFKESKEVQKFNDKVTLVTLYGKTKYCGKINFLPMEIVKWVHTHPIVDNISFALLFGFIIILSISTFISPFKPTKDGIL